MLPDFADLDAALSCRLTTLENFSQSSDSTLYGLISKWNTQTISIVIYVELELNCRLYYIGKKREYTDLENKLSLNDSASFEISS